MSEILVPGSPLLMVNTLVTFLAQSTEAMDGFAEWFAELAAYSPECLRSDTDAVLRQLAQTAQVMQKAASGMRQMTDKGKQALADALPAPARSMQD